MADQYDTALSKAEESKFQAWKELHYPNDSGYDYDLRGAFKAGMKPDPKTGHGDDLFKKPNHPTFSIYSKWAKDFPEKAGTWDGDTYIPHPKPKKFGDGGSAFANLSEMRMRPSPMMSPEQARAYRTIMLNSSLKPSNSPVTANLQGAYSSGPRGSQLMLDPSMSANLGDALTVGGGYRTGPMGGAHGRAEIKLPAGLRALLEGSKSAQRTAVSAPVAGGEMSATLARMAGQGGMPAQMQGRVGYRTPFANGGGADANGLPPEQDESMIDMATRYGQGVMRKHPIITRGLTTMATDPLDLLQWLATHGVDPEIAATMTREEMQDYQKAASSIPNAGELANKYLAQAGVRESETLPEQIGELGVSMLGPAMLAKAPVTAAKGAFSWGKKILGKVSPAKAPALTTDAFHGTRYDFPAFVNEPNKVARGAKDGPFILDQALGTHFAKDPKVSNTFVIDKTGEAIEGGRIIPAKIPDEKTFLEAKQDLLPYIKDRATPRSPSNVHSDQDTIARMIGVEGYKLRPDILARYLVQARGVTEDVAASISQRLAKGKSVPRKELDVPRVVSGPPEFKFSIKGVKKSPWKINKEGKVNLEQFLSNYGGNPHNTKDRAALVETARKSWQDKGYTGIKYMNTSPRETEFATDPISYIVFDPKHTRSRFAQFNPADAESSDLLKSHGGAVHMGKGGLLKAGAEELVELAAKYLPKKFIPHSNPQRNDNLAKFLEGNKAPPVLYHGTPNWEGTAYNPNQPTINNVSNIKGFYADTDPETASNYAVDMNKIADMMAKSKRGEKLDPSEMGYGPSSQVLPVHMAIKKPFVPGNSLITKPMLDNYAAELKATNSHLSDSDFKYWAAGKVKDFAKEKRVSINALNGNGMAYQRVLKAGGYDGLKDGTAYVAFEPTQIKSAIGNRGTFDPTEPDLLKSHGGPVHMGKGGLLKAGAEELVELAAKYLPKAEKVNVPSENATQNLMNWFGKSKVIDADNKPLDMYHGTSRGDFTSFDPYQSEHGLFGQGSYFTDNPEVASSYSGKGAKKIIRKGGEPAPVVYKTHLKIENPIDMDAPANLEKWRKAFPDIFEMDELGGELPLPKNPTNENVYRMIEESLMEYGVPKYEGAETIKDGIQYGMGHDGITHIGGGRVADSSVRHKVYIAFDPEQVKSPFNIKFNPKEEHMGKSSGGPIRKASGGLSRVNEAGNYTKPGMRKQLFNSIKARAVQGTGAGQWSARKAQLLAKSYKEKGGGYKD